MIERDSSGRIIIPGTRRVLRRWTASEHSGLPSFLTLASSGADAGASFARGGDDTLAPYAELAPAESTSATATLEAAQIDLTGVTFLRMTLLGLRFSHPTGIGLRIGDTNRGTSTLGGLLSIPQGNNGGSNAPYAKLVTYPTSSSTNPDPGDSLYVARNGNEYRKIRDLSFIQYPKTRYQFLMERDQAAVAWKHPRLDLGIVTPLFQALMPTSGTIAARNVRFDGVEVEIGFV